MQLCLMPGFAGLLEGNPAPALEALDGLAERWPLAARGSLAGFYLSLGKLFRANRSLTLRAPPDSWWLTLCAPGEWRRARLGEKFDQFVNIFLGKGA